MVEAWKLPSATYARVVVLVTPTAGFLFITILIAMTKIKNELVIVDQKNESMLIDARLLHQQLQISTKFSTWVQRRVEEFGFEENQDFFPILGKSIFGRKPTDYHLTMDMAKELAMLERNEVGKRIRQYFIAVEKEARETAGSAKLLPKGVHSRMINGRKVYPYLRMAEKIGFKSGGSLSARKYRYPNHFIVFDNVTYVSEEMANLMVMTKSLTRHRTAVREMQPLLPLDFGAPIKSIGGTAV